MIVMLIGDILCLPVLLLGIRYGVANNYTTWDWFSLLVPDASDPAELVAWLMLLPLIFFPIATLLVLVIELFRRNVR